MASFMRVGFLLLLVFLLMQDSSGSRRWFRRIRRRHRSTTTPACPPTNCQVGLWSAWSDCSHQCGYAGTQQRTRIKVIVERCVGGICPYHLVEKRPCNRHACQNGGSRGKDRCFCLSGFNGTCCEIVVNATSTPTTLSTTTSVPITLNTTTTATTNSTNTTSTVPNPQPRFAAKCYKCQTLTSPHFECKQTIQTCKKNSVCYTGKYVIKSSGRTIYATGCTTPIDCQSACDRATKTGKVSGCSLRCCDSDLCNYMIVNATSTPTTMGTTTTVPISLNATTTTVPIRPTTRRRLTATPVSSCFCFNGGSPICRFGRLQYCLCFEGDYGRRCQNVHVTVGATTRGPPTTQPRFAAKCFKCLSNSPYTCKQTIETCRSNSFCYTGHYVIKSNGKTIYATGCTTPFDCQSACDRATKSGRVSDCSVRCCNSDLCNYSIQPTATKTPKETPTPKTDHFLRGVLKLLKSLKNMIGSISTLLKAHYNKDLAGLHKREMISKMKEIEATSQHLVDSRDPEVLQAKQDVAETRMRVMQMLKKLDDYTGEDFDFED